MKTQINMQEFVATVQSHFNNSDIRNIMEIGSMNGADSLFFKEKYPDANVFCIEGLPKNYEEFLKNLKNITPINIVVADYDGIINYHEKDINGIHGIFDRGNEYGSTVLNLKCARVDTICNRYNINCLDMIKIDVEGATYEILKSMGEKLKTAKIMHIETESYPFFKGQKLHNQVCDLLEASNFHMLELSSATINQGEQHDSIWINKSYLKQ